MSAPALDAPAAAVSSPRTTGELNAWLFIRISGVVLIILVLGHLLIMNILDGGVHRINFAFVAGRWASRSGKSGTSHAVARDDPRLQTVCAQSSMTTRARKERA